MRPKVILALPGSGKSTLSLTKPGFIDLDFGSLREAFGYDKRNDYKLYKPFGRLAHFYISRGFVVLSNEPGVIPELKQKGIDIAMFIADETTADNIKHRGDTKFAADVRKHWDEWVTGWRKAATQYDVPVVTGKYVSDKIDDLLSASSTKFQNGRPAIRA